MNSCYGGSTCFSCMCCSCTSCCCCTTVSTSEVAVLENCGKYSRIADAGLICLGFPWEYVSGRVSLRVQELNIECETKTKDNVFVRMHISIQYQAIKQKIYSAFYLLSDPKEQMKAYVYDVIRAALPSMDLDYAFESKDNISMNLRNHLEEIMDGFGYSILQALVIDIVPNSRVRDAMNEINSSRRLKEAAAQRAEGEKILRVKRAEAEAESMYLSGLGVSKQRKAIMDGFRENVKELNSTVDATSKKRVMDLLVLSQYFDTIIEVAGNPCTNCIFTTSDHNDVRSGMLQAQQVISSNHMHRS